MKQLQKLLGLLFLLCLLIAACQTTPNEILNSTETPAPVASMTQPAADLPTVTVTPSSTPNPTAEPVRVEITINPQLRYQTLDGFGANCWTFPYVSDLDWNWPAVQYVFDELDIAYIRLAPWLGWWETANDNDDPYSINWQGFGTVNDIINQHDVPFAQFLHEREIELAVGVWDFGGVSEYCETCTDWLASGSPRQIPAELYPELGESIAAYILNMQANGVPIAYAEVQNEPDIEAGIKYQNPEALVEAGNVVLQMFDHYGLGYIPLHGPNLHSPIDNLPWINAWLADENLRQRTAAVSYHTWWSEDPARYEEIWQAAQAYDLPVWATEAGYSGSATSIDPSNWLTAFGYAESYYRAIAWSHASRVYHWSLLGFDGAVGKQGERYPMFYAIKHFANYIPAGAVLFDSSSTDENVRSLVFELPDGSYSLILLNANRAERRINLTGLGGETSQLIISFLDHYDVSVPLDADGEILLPPLSIASMVLQN